jgi:SurA-like N-terminal domain
MLRTAYIALFVILAAAGLHAAEVIDSIVATVNGHAILQSDWEDEFCFEAFLAGRPLDQVSFSERKTALDRLIDQELLREQMQPLESLHVSPADVQRRLQEVRAQFPNAATEQGWLSVLSSYHMTEAELKDRLTRQMEVMRQVENKLRPNVQIDAKSIESYYADHLLPQLRQSGGKEVPLAEVSPKIKELLTQQKVNQLLAAWLQNLRAGSDIRGEGLTQGQAQ